MARRASPTRSDPRSPSTSFRRRSGRRCRAAMLRLSLEYPTLEHYLGTDPRHVDPVFVALIRALDPGQTVVIRLGGDSTDRTWWPIHGMRAPAGINFALTRRWAAMARALATDAGGKLILGINLAAGRRSLAATEARRLVAGVGANHIAALEIGNEPDDYGVTAWYWKHDQRVFARASTYSVNDYLGQFASWRAAMPRSVPVAGPALARTQWMKRRAARRVGAPAAGEPGHLPPLPAAGLRNRSAGLRLSHDPAPAQRPLLRRAGRRGRPVSTAAHRARRPFRLDRLNSVSCQGKFGVSNTLRLGALDAEHAVQRARGGRRWSQHSTCCPAPPTRRSR